VLSEASRAALATKLRRLVDGIARCPAWKPADVAAALLREDRAEPHRIAIVAKDLPALAKSAQQALSRLDGGRDGDGAPWSTRSGIVYGSQRVEGKLAFLFPGEGSQYPAMFADLALCFDEVQQWVDFWHGLYDLPAGHTRTDIVFPSAEIGAEQRKKLEQRMHDMDIGSESVFIGGMAMHELLVSLGVEADVMMGHSSGESAALGASGANPAVTPQDRAACISRHYAVYEELLKAGRIPTGALLAVGALPPLTVEAEVAATGGDVVVAMDNCSNQIVLYGSPDGIARAQKSLSALGGICLPLPFDRGYHTPAFGDVSTAFRQYYADVKLGAPKVPMYSCASVDLFPSDPDAVRALAAAQWSQKVRFRETVQRMHDDGVRIFVEVGPSANLTAFVNDILIDNDFLALSTNVRRKGGVEQLLSVLGQLYVAGRPPRLERLFEPRRIAGIDLDALPPSPAGVLLDNTMPMARLSEADRERLRALATPPHPPVAAAAAAAVATPSPAFQSAGPQSAPPDAVHADGARERVMGEYFGLMRGFLDQQRRLAEDLVPQLPVAVPRGEPPAAPARPSDHARAGRTPLLDEVLQHDAGHVRARCRVSLLNDRFIRDHVMSGPVSATDPTLFGLSCVPFTVSLEVMAEACWLLAGGGEVRVIQDVKAYDWVALDDEAMAFEVSATVVDRAAGRYAASVITARGPVLTAEFHFHAAWQLAGVPALAEPRESCLNWPDLYATGMFHGPVFQSMSYVEGWDDSGIDVQLSEVTLDGFFAEGHRPELVLNPVLLDAMGQVVACWLVQYVGTDFHAFPSTIARLELHEPCPADRAGIVMRMRQRPVDGESTAIEAPRAWQFECTDGEGRVLMRGHDLVNLFFRVPAAYHEVRCDPLNGWLGAPAGVPPGDDVSLWAVPMLSEEFCAQSGSICLRILAHALLSREERAEWKALPGAGRRRREWLFGRAALKEAVRDWVLSQTGVLLHPSDIVVRRSQAGAPVIDGAWCTTLVPAPRVSLAHNQGLCLAALSAGGAIGVDLESIGSVRQPGLVLESMSPGEQALAHGLHGQAYEERVLSLWCAKEAASKCLGIGLQGQPERFRVVAADPDFESVVVEHAGGSSQVQVERVHGNVVAVARPARSYHEAD
jgi:malonyl CoA-acyl carrier protein transacylase/phosphopantetheinyl transferase